MRPEIFFPSHHKATADSRKAYFAFVQTLRIKRVLIAYLQRLQPAEFRDAVLAKLGPDLQRLDIVL